MRKRLSGLAWQIAFVVTVLITGYTIYLNIQKESKPLYNQYNLDMKERATGPTVEDIMIQRGLDLATQLEAVD